MGYIIFGDRYSAAEAKQFFEDNYTPYLAIEFYDLNNRPVNVGYSTFDVNDVIRGLIAIGRIDEHKMFSDFVNDLLRIARNGQLGLYELPYDIEDIGLDYVSDGNISGTKPISGKSSGKPGTSRCIKRKTTGKKTSTASKPKSKQGSSQRKPAKRRC